MSSLRYPIETAACRLLFAAAAVLPRRMIRGIGGLVGRVAYRLNARHRGITLENLRLALGELSADERTALARECWQNFGRNIVDTLCFPRFGPQSTQTLVHYKGLEHIRAAYAAGRGVLIFSGHFGHWELTALMQGFLEMPLLLLARPLDNPSLERLFADLRGRSGNRVVHKHNAMREVMRALRAGEGVAIVIDQDARSDGVFVPFFGRPASTTPSLARLALRTGAAIVPTFSVPQPDGSYRVTYEAPVAIHPTDDLEGDVLRVTAECTAILERWVRAHPSHWLWMHRRWKTDPGEASRG